MTCTFTGWASARKTGHYNHVTNRRARPALHLAAALFEEDHEDGDVGGADATDAGGLAEVEGLELVELFAGFEAELFDAVVASY